MPPAARIRAVSAGASGRWSELSSPAPARVSRHARVSPALAQITCDGVTKTTLAVEPRAAQLAELGVARGEGDAHGRAPAARRPRGAARRLAGARARAAAYSANSLAGAHAAEHAAGEEVSHAAAAVAVEDGEESVIGEARNRADCAVRVLHRRPPALHRAEPENEPAAVAGERALLGERLHE